MTEDDIRQMIADMEIGTKGPWHKVGWEPSAIYGGPYDLMGAELIARLVRRSSPEVMSADGRRLKRVPDLEAEVIRLRKALAEIATGPDHLHDAQVARDALKGGDQ